MGQPKEQCSDDRGSPMPERFYGLQHQPPKDGFLCKCHSQRNGKHRRDLSKTFDLRAWDQIEDRGNERDEEIEQVASPSQRREADGLPPLQSGQQNNDDERQPEVGKTVERHVGETEEVGKCPREEINHHDHRLHNRNKPIRMTFDELREFHWGLLDADSLYRRPDREQ